LGDRREGKLEIDGGGHGIGEVQLILLLEALILEGRSAVLRHQAVHRVLCYCVSRLCMVRVIWAADGEMRREWGVMVR
jgi:hypothetical protein